MRRTLELLGLRRSPESVDLFRTWHTYAALGIAAVVIGLISRIG